MNEQEIDVLLVKSIEMKTCDGTLTIGWEKLLRIPEYAFSAEDDKDIELRVRHEKHDLIEKAGGPTKVLVHISRPFCK